MNERLMGASENATEMRKRRSEKTQMQTRELGSSGPYAMLFCLDDLDKKKHRDVINSYKFLLFVFRHNLGFEPALSPCMHPPIHFAYILILPRN